MQAEIVFIYGGIIMKKEYRYNKGLKAIVENLEDESCGIYPAPMDSQTALNILTSYLLGDDFVVAGSLNIKQLNAIVVEQILDKYSPKWRKDWRRYKQWKDESDRINEVINHE